MAKDKKISNDLIATLCIFIGISIGLLVYNVMWLMLQDSDLCAGFGISAASGAVALTICVCVNINLRAGRIKEKL